MSIRPLILKDGVHTIPRSSTDINNTVDSLGVVDTNRNQTIGGIKTFSSPFVLSSTTGTSVGTIWRNVDTLEYKDSTNTTKIVLNSAGNLANLSNKQTSLNNLVGTQTTNRVLRSDGTNVTLSQVALNTDVVNVLSLSNGGTGSNIQNFVDLTTDQTSISGLKTFTKALNSPQLFSGYVSNSSNKALGDSDFINPQMAKVFNFFGADYTPTVDPGTTWSVMAADVSVLGTTNLTSIGTGGFFRVRHLGTSTLTTVQGLRLIGLNASTGTVTNLTGAYFAARNDSTGTVTNLTGGDFVATSGSAGIATTLIGGRFTASITNANATTTTLIGAQLIVGGNNTVAAANAIGLDVPSITGTATNKIAIRTSVGKISFGDTTQASSTTSAAITGVSLGLTGGLFVGGTINFSGLPTSSSGLQSGSLWKNGTVINIVP